MTNDDSITLTLPRHEVAALVLYHLNKADLYEWEMDNCGSDPLDLAQLRFPHFQRVKELDEHMTDDLRAWVTEQRDKEGRELLIATVETFVREASNKQIRAIYDLTLALKMRAANKAANPLVDEEED
jgi:hypothetical protein